MAKASLDLMWAVDLEEVDMSPYEPDLEATMKRLYESLNERDRRRYAGVEALKLGPGGRNYIAGVLGCSRRTVSKGGREVVCPPGQWKPAFGNRGEAAKPTPASGPTSMRNFWPYCATIPPGIRWTKRCAGPT